MKIGDKIEVKFSTYDSGRGRMRVVDWALATVVAIYDDAILAELINGLRMEVERGRNKFRKVNR